MRIFARDGAEYAKSRCDGIAAALNGEFYDVFGVEINRIRRERGAGGVLYVLVNGQDGEVAGVGEAAVGEHRLKA